MDVFRFLCINVSAKIIVYGKEYQKRASLDKKRYL